MTEDEVVREVRAAREAFAASHGYDIRAMLAALHEWGAASGREVVRFALRSPQQPDQRPRTGAATPVPGNSPLTGATPAGESGR
jgi:hypothetical protein